MLLTLGALSRYCVKTLLKMGISNFFKDAINPSPCPKETIKMEVSIFHFKANKYRHQGLHFLPFLIFLASSVMSYFPHDLNIFHVKTLSILMYLQNN